MKIIVYGLGIIGASICASLKKASHNIMGKNRSKPAVEYALTHGYIDGEAQSFNGADVVILALPPRACINVLDRESFPDGCIVTDICGVKTSIEKSVYAKKEITVTSVCIPWQGKRLRESHQLASISFKIKILSLRGAEKQTKMLYLP